MRTTGAAAALLMLSAAASAQSITVLPVNIDMAAGQMATTLTVINQGDAETSVQIRALSWSQVNGEETLTPSDDVVASPPIATIAPGATQVVRLVLRTAPKDKEATYRVLLDQIPPAAAPGTVRIALRLSIPVFALPATRAVPHVQFRLEHDGGQAYLVAVNDGERHETLRDITLTTSQGGKLNTAANASPYVLTGATRRWPITMQGRVPGPGETLRVSAQGISGAIDQPVGAAAKP